MSAKVDLTGHVYGRLTVLKEVGRKHGKVLWLCRCECGKETRTTGNAMRRGNTTSCGCLNKEAITKHGWATDPIYKVWGKMRDRCNNPKAKDYGAYGGRGITICSEWNDIGVFAQWAYKNNYRTNLQIDRIDNDGNYCPENCRFVTASENICNRRMLKNNKSGYTGVCWHKGEKMFQASIHYNGRRVYLGYHNTAREAAIVRDEHVLKNNLSHKLQVLNDT